MNEDESLFYALKYWKMGLMPVPVKIVYQNNKKNLIFPVKWRDIKELSEKEVTDMFKQYHGYGVAVLCGAVSGNLTLIDFDRDVYPNEERILKKYDLYSSCVKTGKGYHFMFRSDKSFESNTSVGEQVDVKSDGGLSIMPPTTYNNDHEQIYYKELMDFDVKFLTLKQAKMLFNELQLKIKNKNEPVQTRVENGNTVFENEVLRTFKPIFVEGNYEMSTFAVAGYFSRLGISKDETFKCLKLLNDYGDNYDKQINNVLKEAYDNIDRVRVAGLPKIVEITSTLGLPEIVKKNIEDFDKKYRPNNISILTTHIEDTSIGVPDEYKEYFHRDKIREAQYDIMGKLFKSESKNIVVQAPTGIGKTEVYLSYARYNKFNNTMIVVPDRAMENQLLDDYDIFAIKGKANYSCGIYPEQNAEMSNCNFEKQHTCPSDCPWRIARSRALSLTQHNGIIATNFANYKRYVNENTIIIFDEFHKIIKELSHPVEIPNGYNLESLPLLISGIESEIDELFATISMGLEAGEDVSSYKLQHKKLLSKMGQYQFMYDNKEYAFSYVKYNRTYIKLDETGLFNYMLHSPNKQIFISATPLKTDGYYELITTDKNVVNRKNAPVVYMPLANMSRYSIMEQDFMKIASFITDKVLKDGKAIIHTVSTEYASILSKFLNRFKCAIHEKGNLSEVMEKFRNGNYDILLTASGDSGFDFYGDKFKQQFIIKVPYPARDSEWAGLAEKVGNDEMEKRYNQAAVDTIVQICGRIARGSDDSGITYILDSKFTDLYLDNRDNFRQISSRILDLSGKLSDENFTLMATSNFGEYVNGQKFTARPEDALRLISDGKVVVVS